MGARSKAAFVRAQGVIPGGVNSPVRAFRSVGGNPVFIDRAEGSRLFDIDGNSYIDYVGSWGPMIVGHAHPEVVEAIRSAAGRGTSYGAPTEGETQLAEMIRQAMPAVEMVRLVNSGTEATMSAVRLARAYTKRRRILKFIGCYHGHSDAFLIQAGSGAMTLGVPDSPGVTPGAAADTLTVAYNDAAAVSRVFAEYGQDIAAVIVEPIAGNMGVVLPEPGFLSHLRQITEQAGSLLIFDEVITGFRVGYGGAQQLYGITPDLTCLGKIIGGGLPVGAYGGRADIMALVAPAGPVYQAGTLAGNPLAVAAGIAALRILSQPGVYEQLEQMGALLAKGLADAATAAGVDIYQTRVGSMLCSFFTAGPVRDYATALHSDTGFYARYFRAMLARGSYFAPSQFEAAFVSLAHTADDIAATVAAAREALLEAAAAK